jgi:hypothetical protein
MHVSTLHDLLHIERLQSVEMSKLQTSCIHRPLDLLNTILRIRLLYNYTNYMNILFSMNVGPCHHGMARPQVEDRGTASNMEGSCE